MRKTSYVPAPFAPRSTDGSTWATAGTVAYADATYYSDTALALATRYYYRVMATDSASTASPASNIASAVTGPTFEVSEGSSGSLESAVVVDTEASCAACEVDPIISEDVDWGDGSSSTESGDPDSMSHYFSNPGSYTVTVIANTADGPVDSSSTTADVTVAVPEPTLEFSSSTMTVGQGAGFALHPEYCSDGAEAESEYLLDWGDGTPYQSYSDSTTEFDHCYAHGGSDYHVEAFLETSVGVVGAGADITVTGSNPIDDPGTYSTGFSLSDTTTGSSLPATTGDTVQAFVTATMHDYSCSCGGGDDPESECGTVDFGNSSSGGFYFSNASGSEPCEAIDNSYHEDGQYLITMTASDGSDETKFATVDNAVPVMNTIPEQVAGSGESFSVSDNYSNMSTELNPVAFINWGDGTGPHVATVSPSGASGTITASTSSAPAPGVYTATLTLYPMGPTGTGGGPTYAVTKTFTLDVWGVKIDHGESNDVLIASADGTQNLQEVTAYFPHPSGEALDMTLSGSDDSEDLVWDTGAPTDSDTPVVGPDSSSYDFSVSSTASTTKEFWVAAIDGDTTAAVEALTLTGSPDLGDSTSGFVSIDMSQTNVNYGAATTQSNHASDLAVKVTLDSNPNTDPTADGTAAHPYNFLVGQMVNLTANITGPATVLETYRTSWDIPGNILSQYQDNHTSAFPVTLEQGEGGGKSLDGAGTAVEELSYFWVSTSYDPSVAAGPDQNSITFTATSITNSADSVSAAMRINVFSPTPTETVAHGDVGLGPIGKAVALKPIVWNDGQPHAVTLSRIGIALGLLGNQAGTVPEGATFGASVSTPAVAAFSNGTYKFVQLVSATNTMKPVNPADKDLHNPMSGVWGIDSDKDGMPTDPEPYGVSSTRNGNGAFPATPFTSAAKDGWVTGGAAGFVNDAPNVTVGYKASGTDVPSNVPKLQYSNLMPNASTLSLHYELRTYVMYKAPGVTSQWVPLSVEIWSLSAAARLVNPPPPQGPFGDFAAPVWEVIGKDTSLTVPPNFQRATEEPTWEKVITPAGRTPA